ncbi:sulfite exporter TauE/SafE family protein [Ralstonia pseudosolanacearum]|uniref:sulfite exporter TauE/SafE family protein n=1 Tax=Ralstonia pseudosolanacearum TaxID=1310165 RepID=UPI001FFACCA1|nr:sulfite exporter TauE/SafE family protein [Ralstonia pseudosolanacearum]
MSAAALLSVFLIALLGGVHCLAMCSGIALAAERAQPAVRIVSRRRLWFEQLVMHLGRLTTYALLGAAMGALGATVWRQQWLPIQRGLFALASALLLAYGLLLLSRTAADVWRGAWLERVLGRLSGGLAAVASRVRASSLRARFPLAGRYLTGLAWGLVPCGMVYGALAVALLAGNAASGAVVMLVFGAGTLPNLLMMSGVAGWLRGVSRMRWARGVAGIGISAFGIWGLVCAAWLPEMLNAHGFCLVL